MPTLTRFAVTLAAILLASPMAQAQLSPFKGKGPKMSGADIALMDRAAEPLFQADPFKPGATASWKNDQTGFSGTVTLMNEKRFQGMLCRNVKYDIMNQARQTERPYLVDWCRTPDGTWKMR
jgi:surface antigen